MLRQQLACRPGLWLADACRSVAQQLHQSAEIQWSEVDEEAVGQSPGACVTAIAAGAAGAPADGAPV